MLQRRGNFFTSRIIVPRDLQGILGRVEITRSLRTADPREANRRRLLWEPHIGTLLGLLRKNGRFMTKDQLDALTRQYLVASFDQIEERLALDWTPEGLEIHSSQLNERCHELSGALASADLSGAMGLAAEMAPGADELSLRKLARRLIEVRLDTAVAELRALAGETLMRPEASLAPQEASGELLPMSPKVSEVAAMYAQERIARGLWSPKTAKQGAAIFQVIAEMLGDPMISLVGKGDIRRLGLDIPKLPANRSKKYPGLPIVDVLARIDQDETVDRLEPRSVNKHYQHVRTLFAWAAEHDHIAQSPATVLHDVEEGRAQEARKVLEDSEIVVFFAHIEMKSREPYGLWIPRIMAFTGCRMGEAAQLRKEDVRMEQGVLVFDFNEESDQKNLKTNASNRRVPIHPRLLELGFLEFVEGCGEGFLFPERVRFTENPGRGNMDLLSKQLNRWLRAAGITDRRKTVQSFRGTMVTRLKDQGVAEHHIAELVGHENDNITTGRYGKASSMETLRAAISKLGLPI